MKQSLLLFLAMISFIMATAQNADSENELLTKTYYCFGQQAESLLKFRPNITQRPQSMSNIGPTAYNKKILDTQILNYELIDINGNKHKMSEYCAKGNYVIINFWYPGCGPAMRFMKDYLLPCYSKYRKERLNVININIIYNSEQRSDIQQFNDWRKDVRQSSNTWVHLSTDQKRAKITNYFDVRSIPTAFLVDPTGKIVACGLYAYNSDIIGTAMKRIYGY